MLGDLPSRSSSRARTTCDHLKFYIADKLVAEADPDRAEFPHLRYAPFSADLRGKFHPWGDLRMEGYIQGKQVISKTLSGSGLDKKFILRPDDTQLIADGSDTTRVVLRVTNEFDAIRPFASDSIRLELEGQAELIGDNPFSLVGGTGAVWIRAGQQTGEVKLRATHPILGLQEVSIQIGEAQAERI